MLARHASLFGLRRCRRLRSVRRRAAPSPPPSPDLQLRSAGMRRDLRERADGQPELRRLRNDVRERDSTCQTGKCVLRPGSSRAADPACRLERPALRQRTARSVRAATSATARQRAPRPARRAARSALTARAARTPNCAIVARAATPAPAARPASAALAAAAAPARSSAAEAASTSPTTTNCGSCGNKCGSGQTCTNGSCTGGGSTGGSTGTGGTSTGTGGSGTGTGGSGTGTGGSGTGTGGSGTGTGGSGTGTGGSGTGTGGSSQACRRSRRNATVISDFEDGTTGDVRSRRAAARAGGTCSPTPPARRQTPAANATGPIAVAMRPRASQLRHLRQVRHAASTTTGHAHTTRSYRASATRSPRSCRRRPPRRPRRKNPYDVSAYNGISFNIKSGSGTAPPVWFEIGMTGRRPSPDGTAVNRAVDEYNTRGTAAHQHQHQLDDGLRSVRHAGATLPSRLDRVRPARTPPSSARRRPGIRRTCSGCSSPSTRSSRPRRRTTTSGSTTSRFYTGSNGLATFTPGISPATEPSGDASAVVHQADGRLDGKFLVDLYTRWKSTFVIACGGTACHAPGERERHRLRGDRLRHVDRGQHGRQDAVRRTVVSTSRGTRQRKRAT